MSRDDALIASYLLGELAPGAQAAVEARAARDPRFAAALERTRPVVARLEEMPERGWPEGDPPALPALPPLPGLARPRRLARRGLRPAAVAVTAVVLLAAGVGAWLAGRGGEGGGPPIALGRVGDAGASARGDARVEGDALRVRVTGLAPSRDGGFYEVWLMDDADRLMSLGSFRVPASGDAAVDVPLPVAVRDFAYIDVSSEPNDGDPRHSGASVLRGPTRG